MKSHQNISIVEYIKKKQKLLDTTFIIEAGTGEAFYLSEGIRISAKEFEKAHKPVVVSFIALNAENSDHTKDWMCNEK